MLIVSTFSRFSRFSRLHFENSINMNFFVAKFIQLETCRFMYLKILNMGYEISGNVNVALPVEMYSRRKMLRLL